MTEDSPPVRTPGDKGPPALTAVDGHPSAHQGRPQPASGDTIPRGDNSKFNHEGHRMTPVATPMAGSEPAGPPRTKGNQSSQSVGRGSPSSDQDSVTSRGSSSVKRVFPAQQQMGSNGNTGMFSHPIKLQSFIEQVLDHSFENPADPELLSSKPSSISSSSKPSPGGSVPDQNKASGESSPPLSGPSCSPDVDVMSAHSQRSTNNHAAASPSNNDDDDDDDEGEGALVMAVDDEDVIRNAGMETVAETRPHHDNQVDKIKNEGEGRVERQHERNEPTGITTGRPHSQNRRIHHEENIAAAEHRRYDENGNKPAASSAAVPTRETSRVTTSKSLSMQDIINRVVEQTHATPDDTPPLSGNSVVDQPAESKPTHHHIPSIPNSRIINPRSSASDHHFNSSRRVNDSPSVHPGVASNAANVREPAFQPSNAPVSSIGGHGAGLSLPGLEHLGPAALPLLSSLSAVGARSGIGNPLAGLVSQFHPSTGTAQWQQWANALAVAAAASGAPGARLTPSASMYPQGMYSMPPGLNPAAFFQMPASLNPYAMAAAASGMQPLASPGGPPAVSRGSTSSIGAEKSRHEMTGMSAALTSPFAQHPAAGSPAHSPGIPNMTPSATTAAQAAALAAATLTQGGRFVGPSPEVAAAAYAAAAAAAAAAGKKEGGSSGQEQPMDLSLKRKPSAPTPAPRPAKLHKPDAIAAGGSGPPTPLDLSNKQLASAGSPHPQRLGNPTHMGAPLGSGGWVEGRPQSSSSIPQRTTTDMDAAALHRNSLENESPASAEHGWGQQLPSPSRPAATKGPGPLPHPSYPSNPSGHAHPHRPPSHSGGGDAGATPAAGSSQSTYPPKSATPPRGSANPSSITALIGNHPANDILYLHCTHCQSTYGSIHGFRKHFRNAHGYNPRPEDVAVQSISATKRYMDSTQHQKLVSVSTPSDEDDGGAERDGLSQHRRSGGNSSAAPSQHKARHGDPVSSGGSTSSVECYVFHCALCGAQYNKHERYEFSAHQQRHMDGSTATLYKCMYCSLPQGSSERLLDHLRCSHDDVLHHVCAYCSIAFSSASTLREHAVYQHGHRSFTDALQGHQRAAAAAAAAGFSSSAASGSPYDSAGSSRYHHSDGSSRGHESQSGFSSGGRGHPAYDAGFSGTLTLGEHIDKAVERELTRQNAAAAAPPVRITKVESPTTTTKGVEDQSVSSTMGHVTATGSDEGHEVKAAVVPRSVVSPEGDVRETRSRSPIHKSSDTIPPKMNLMQYLNHVVEKGVNGEPIDPAPSLRFFGSAVTAGVTPGTTDLRGVVSPDAVQSTTANRLVSPGTNNGSPVRAKE